jgi:hypothetical protein
MESMINPTHSKNGYLQHFYVAQKNLKKVVEEERLLKKIRRSKQQSRYDE